MGRTTFALFVLAAGVCLEAIPATGSLRHRPSLDCLAHITAMESDRSSSNLAAILFKVFPEAAESEDELRLAIDGALARLNARLRRESTPRPREAAVGYLVTALSDIIRNSSNYAAEHIGPSLLRSFLASVDNLEDVSHLQRQLKSIHPGQLPPQFLLVNHFSHLHYTRFGGPPARYRKDRGPWQDKLIQVEGTTWIDPSYFDLPARDPGFLPVNRLLNDPDGGSHVLELMAMQDLNRRGHYLLFAGVVDMRAYFKKHQAARERFSADLVSVTFDEEGRPHFHTSECKENPVIKLHGLGQLRSTTFGLIARFGAENIGELYYYSLHRGEEPPPEDSLLPPFMVGGEHFTMWHRRLALTPQAMTFSNGGTQ